MQKKVLSLFLCICIFIMMMPTVVFGETKEVLTTSNKIIYTDVSVGSSSEQDGSLEKPYYDIADAIYAAKDGDTIVIKSSGGYVNDLTSGDLGQNAPLIIDKRVTIQGEGDSMPSLNMRRGGIILAEDVTFRNFNFNYTNSIGAVFANGHSLVMENIGCIRGTELIDIFGGSLSGQTVDYGDKSKIIVTGTKTNIGDIFAGSQDKDWTQDVDITVEGRVGNIGSIYAAGKSSSSSGEVTINLKNSNVKNVDGKQGESILKNAVVSVSVEGTNDLMSFQNVGILELMKGKLKPKVLNEDIEIKIHSGSSLDLSSVTKTNPSFKIRKLNGDEGSILYTDQDASLNINESFTGMIEFRTVNEASLMQEESGLVRLDHVYIYVENAPEKQGVFTFIPYFTQKDEVVLSDMDGKWTAVPIKEKEATESAIDVTVSTEEDESLYEKNDKLKYPSNSRTFKTQQIISKSDENTVNGYENLREVLKEQILPQSVNTLIKTFPITFQYLDNSDIGIGLNLYSGSWLPDNNLLASTVGYVTLSTVFEEVNDRVVMDLYYTLAVNYDMLSFSNNDIGELTPDGRKYLESTISHEMMHAMMYEALTSGMLGVSEDNPRSHKAKMFPSWFIEGTAQAAGGGANIVRRTLDITADSEESDIKSKLQRYHLNKGNTYADYGTGYLATMYLGYLMNGEDSIKKEDISNGLDKFLNEIRGGKSLNRAIVDNTKYLSISDFENNFANDAARFTKRLMVDIGNDGLGALMGGSYQDTDILDDKAINTNVFNLNSQYNRVLNIYPKDYVVMAGGQKETDGVAGPR
ncbi:hypothetical protein PBV87_17870, partial [Niameybacter massiliensis]